MKKFCLLLVGVIAFVLTSCEEKIPPQPIKVGAFKFNYVFKKKDGKILTGVERIFARGKTKNIIPVKYEKITAGFNNTFFLVYQGNEAKVVNEEGKFLFDGMSIKPESIKFLGDDFHMAPFYGFRFEDMNGKKYWWFSFRYLFSGYDDLIPCVNGFIFKKGNKYGFAKFGAYYDELKFSYIVTQEFEVTISEKYDALYEITNNLSYYNYFFLAKSRNKWMVLNSDGKMTKRAPSQINKNLVNIPIQEKVQTDVFGEIKGKSARTGQENAGLITLTLSEYTWNSYFR